jgi:hypothetical protein
MHRPNGITLNAHVLYVTDNHNDAYETDTADLDVYANHRVLYSCHPGGSIPDTVNDTVHADVEFDFGMGRGPDGLVVSPNGTIYVTAGFNTLEQATPVEDLSNPAGIYVFATESNSCNSGPQLQHIIPIEEDMVTNVALHSSGALYATAGYSVFEITRAIQDPNLFSTQGTRHDEL